MTVSGEDGIWRPLSPESLPVRQRLAPARSAARRLRTLDILLLSGCLSILGVVYMYLCYLPPWPLFSSVLCDLDLPSSGFKIAAVDDARVKSSHRCRFGLVLRRESLPRLFGQKVKPHKSTSTSTRAQRRVRVILGPSMVVASGVASLPR